MGSMSQIYFLVKQLDIPWSVGVVVVVVGNPTMTSSRVFFQLCPESAKGQFIESAASRWKCAGQPGCIWQTSAPMLQSKNLRS